MTRKQANDVWMVVTVRVIFRQEASEDFRNDSVRMREFAIAVMQQGGIRRPAKLYDWAEAYLASKSREAIAEEILEHPDILMFWAENPIWKRTGIAPPWAVN